VLLAVSQTTNGVALALAFTWFLAAPSLAQAPSRISRRVRLQPSVAPAVRIDLTTGLTDPHEHAHPRAHRERPRADGWAAINSGVSEVFFRFFGSITPSASGVERPSPDEHMLDAVVAPLGHRLSFVVLGAGNNHLLTSTYFYQQYDGISGLRYGFVPEEAGSPFQLSLTGSPLHGSLSQVTRHMGLENEADAMPSAFLLGGAVGLDFTYTSNAVRFEARSYAMPEVDTGHAHSTGVSTMQSVQLVLPLTEMFQGRPDLHFDLYFVGMHVERGDARAAIYDWSAQGFRSIGELRELWQAMVVLTIRGH
jgi:hypothetical protein